MLTIRVTDVEIIFIFGISYRVKIFRATAKKKKQKKNIE